MNMDSNNICEKQKEFRELLEKAACCHPSVSAWANYLHSVVTANPIVFFNNDPNLIVRTNGLLSKAIQQNSLSEESFKLLEIIWNVIENAKRPLRRYHERLLVNRKISKTKQDASLQKEFFPQFEQYCAENPSRSKHANARIFYRDLPDEVKARVAKEWPNAESFYTAYKNRNQQAGKRKKRDTEMKKLLDELQLPEGAVNWLQQWIDKR